jgi:hypothetical protein
MKTASLASLLILAATACGGASPRPTAPGNTAPPGVAGCDPSGPELFAVRTTPKNPGMGLDESATILYASGAWTSKGQAVQSGCLAPADLSRAEQLLTDLPLVVHRPAPDEPRCDAEAMSSTTYSVRGTAVYTAEICSGVSLDDKSTQAFNEVSQLLATAATTR